MGTNYYLHSAGCPCCGRSDPPLRIGKSAAGWCFALQVYPDGTEGGGSGKIIRDLWDWIKLWANERESVIKDEYGKEVTPLEMIDCIVNRTGRDEPQSKVWLLDNQAVMGPRNLAQPSKWVEGGPKITYVQGETYYLHEGEFL